MNLPKYINRKISHTFSISKGISKSKIANESDKFEIKLQEIFKKLFPSLIVDNKKLKIYSSIKNVIRFEPYLKLLPDVDSRIAMYRFRASCHNFPIETGRYKNIPQIQRLCNKCNLNEVGSEEHILFRCLHPTILDHRKKLFGKINSLCPQFSRLPQSNKLQYLLSCSDNDLVLICSKFLKDCLNLYRT